MNFRWMRRAAVLGLVSLGSAPALAFDTVDAIPWPSAGAFYPGYVGDPATPWSVGAYGGVMWDDNVRRTPGGAETSDFISRVGIGGRYAARVIGRQSIALDGYGEYRNYDKLSQFDHFAYGLRGRWLWELGNQLAGVVSLRRVHRLADIGETSSAIRDLVTADYFDFGAAYRFHPDFRLTGGFGANRIAHDGRDLDTTHSTGARAGIEYVTGLGNTIGLEYRQSQGSAPVDPILGLGVFDDNDYEEESIAVTLFYALGEQLRVRGRLGHTERTYSQLSVANFSGTTGSAAIEWLPGMKIRFTADVYREPDPVIDATALYVDRKGFGVGAAWAITYKVVLSARYFHERRLYEGDPLVIGSGVQRDELVRITRIGLGWEPQRRWQFSTALDFGDRSSNLLDRDYEFTAVTVNLQWRF